ncbi:helix-turn-helix domain-containing protein [Acidipropionibacterium jensenii]|uniref:Helix-turn-helix domain-containing protein n=1 Tax=Acidipropionibacterium jensenii TaxID=1749 RepID=A0A448P2R0_9ACTN|nr:helix-turn-helix domain-containing protein [Acidipropionibacterium jensenii]MDN5977478.1 helix-turn-helix domain-containing protein [Acidipropionibacterium jensenii]MDN5996340.1 helix-turn-helix domain-containing protein [Acidipropionibacterium jensenii]MDN6021766.1 helix-turn-helix domain-containing protein [Acidipropionibacterium jensenii]MDN6426772.1 helix-turn-helix domain-containing protein [Acidipropionibacterium jensenii]MDN6441870.1 helix-turn-helix domain-containing protein [Acidip
MPARQPRLTGDQRRAMAEVLAQRYDEGASIRSLAVEFGRSYGLVQRLLAEAGVEFRARGGADPSSPMTRAERESEAPTDDSRDAPEQPREPDEAAETVTEEQLAKAEAKARRATNRLSKALRARAKLTKANSSKKQRRAAKKKVANRRLKSEKAADRLERIREQLDAHTGH